MKTVIGAYRKADKRDFHDRAYGRPAPTDLLIRLGENDNIEEIKPDLPENVTHIIHKAIAHLLKHECKLPCVFEENGIAIRIYEVLKRTAKKKTITGKGEPKPKQQTRKKN